MINGRWQSVMHFLIRGTEFEEVGCSMPRYPVMGITALIVAVLLIAACGSSSTPTPIPASAAASYAPVTIESCATTTGSDADIATGSISFTYEEPPIKAVTLNQHTTEVMLALGLENSMIGTAYIDDAILPEYLAAYDTIPVLAGEYPSKEALLNVEPDFVYGGFSSAFGIVAAGSQEELKTLGISSYLTAAICEETADTLDDVYTDIRNIGNIFGVAEQAESLISGFEEQIQQVQAALGVVEQPLRVFLYDSGDDAPYTSVCCAMFTTLIEAVGAGNIFDDIAGRWKTVNWEEVIQRDPEVIVLTDAVWSTAQEKIDLLLSTAAYADITAIKDQRFVVLKFSSLVPGIRNPATIRELAEGIYPGRFQ